MEETERLSSSRRRGGVLEKVPLLQLAACLLATLQGTLPYMVDQARLTPNPLACLALVRLSETTSTVHRTLVLCIVAPMPACRPSSESYTSSHHIRLLPSCTAIINCSSASNELRATSESEGAGTTSLAALTFTIDPLSQPLLLAAHSTAPYLS